MLILLFVFITHSIVVNLVVYFHNPHDLLVSISWFSIPFIANHFLVYSLVFFYNTKASVFDKFSQFTRSNANYIGALSWDGQLLFRWSRSPLRHFLAFIETDCFYFLSQESIVFIKGVRKKKMPWILYLRYWMSKEQMTKKGKLIDIFSQFYPFSTANRSQLWADLSWPICCANIKYFVIEILLEFKKKYFAGDQNFSSHLLLTVFTTFFIVDPLL